MPRIAKRSSDPPAAPAPIPALAPVLSPLLGLAIGSAGSLDWAGSLDRMGSLDRAGATGPLTVARLSVVMTVCVAFAFKKTVVEDHVVVVLVVVAEALPVEPTVMNVVT
jgi:hypothetical protein